MNNYPIYELLYNTTINCNSYGIIQKIDCCNKRKKLYDFVDLKLQGPLSVCNECVQDWKEEKGDRLYDGTSTVINRQNVLVDGVRHCDRCFKIVPKSNYNVRMRKCLDCLNKNIDRRKSKNK